jgi:hypothetical protein
VDESATGSVYFFFGLERRSDRGAVKRQRHQLEANRDPRGLGYGRLLIT